MSKLAHAAAVLAVLSVMGSGAQAQTADQPSPARLALARQIFEAQGGAKNVQQTMDVLKKSMSDLAPNQEAKDRMAKVMDTTVKLLFPKLFDDLAGYYALDYTEDQLKDILAFYKTATGQAMIANAPVLAGQIGGSMAKLMPKLQLKVLDQVCSQGACSDQQQQQLTALKQRVPEHERL